VAVLVGTLIAGQGRVKASLVDAILGALAAVARDDEGRIAIQEAGGIPLIIKLMDGGPDMVTNILSGVCGSAIGYQQSCLPPVVVCTQVFLVLACCFVLMGVLRARVCLQFCLCAGIACQDRPQSGLASGDSAHGRWGIDVFLLALTGICSAAVDAGCDGAGGAAEPHGGDQGRHPRQWRHPRPHAVRPSQGCRPPPGRCAGATAQEANSRPAIACMRHLDLVTYCRGISVLMTL